MCISFGIFATTIQTQDFKDVEGDKKINRQTLPIIFPKESRYTPIVALLAWSIALSYVWRLPTTIAATFIALAVFVGLRFLSRRTRHDDQVSFYWYNVSQFPPYLSIALINLEGLALGCACSSRRLDTYQPTIAMIQCALLFIFTYSPFLRLFHRLGLSLIMIGFLGSRALSYRLRGLTNINNLRRFALDINDG